MVYRFGFCSGCGATLESVRELSYDRHISELDARCWDLTWSVIDLGIEIIDVRGPDDPIIAIGCLDIRYLLQSILFPRVWSQGIGAHLLVKRLCTAKRLCHSEQSDEPLGLS